MLVDPTSGHLTAVAQQALQDRGDATFEPPDLGTHLADPGVEPELFLQQIETTTPPTSSMNELDRQLRAARREAGRLAEGADAAVVAVPTPVLDEERASLTPKSRYRQIRDHFGELADTSLACAMHIHVSLVDDEDGAVTLDRLAPWLPILLAISANSPYWCGHDTGYASWRTQIWTRWPSNGTGQPFGSRETYEDVVERLVDWGVALDNGMVYFDARLSSRFPTIEFRVPDVCTDAEDAILLSALARGLVDTAADPATGHPVPTWRSDLLRAASWRASRHGLSGDLVSPDSMELTSSRAAVESLVDHVRPALEHTEDDALVHDLLERVLARGGGATRQRRIFEKEGSLEAVVTDLRNRTEESWSDRATWVSDS